MSSIIIIQQTDAVHLISDGAGYDNEGVVQRVASKIHSLPLANCIYASRGCTWTEDALAVMMACYSSFDEIATELPDFLLRLKSAAVAAGVAVIDRTFIVTVAGWSDALQKWAAVVYSSWDKCDPHDVDGLSFIEGYETCRPILASTICCAPPVEELALGRPVESQSEVDAIDPVQDGITLIEVQRARPLLISEAHARYVVGGFAELGSVSAAGIDRRVIKEWPDKIGAHILPEGLLQMSDLEALSVQWSAELAASREQEIAAPLCRHMVG